MGPDDALKVLVVEDHRGDAELVCSWLSDIPGWEFDLRYATSVREAQEALAEPVDAVLLDLELPDSSGVDTLVRIREAAPHVPLVVLSGIPLEARPSVLAAGADDFISKDEPQRTLFARSVLYAIERKAAQLHASQLGVLIEQSPDAVLLIGADSEIRFASSAAARLFGQPAAALVSTKVSFPIDCDSPFEAAITRPGGEIRTVDVRLVEVRWQGESVTMATVRDLTEQRRLEAQLRGAQKLEASSRLAAGVAHEFNNILTSIFTFASLARDDSGLNAEVRTHAQEVLRGADRARSLVDQLLTLSRAKPTQPEQIDVGDMVLGMDRLLRRTLGPAIELSTLVTDDPWPVLADRGQLEQVLLNLALNARDAMPRGGKLTLAVENLDGAEIGSSRAADEAVRIRVTDSGTGIAPDQLDRVFEPFFTTKPSGKGTGLGLPVCLGIVRQAGGDILLQSSLGWGTTADVILPRSAVTHESAQAEMPVAAPDYSGSERVLVVDDDVQLGRAVWRILQRYGYSVTKVQRASEALRVLRDSDDAIDLVLSDLMMPEMTGLELRNQIRSTYPELPVLLMTGFGEPGADDDEEVLRKPFLPATLLRFVRTNLDKLPDGERSSV